MLSNCLTLNILLLTFHSPQWCYIPILTFLSILKYLSTKLQSQMSFLSFHFYNDNILNTKLRVYLYNKCFKHYKDCHAVVLLGNIAITCTH